MNIGILGDVSSERAPRAGDVRFAESGEIEVFDGQHWGPIRQLPAGGPFIFRGDPMEGETADAESADTAATEMDS